MDKEGGWTYSERMRIHSRLSRFFLPAFLMLLALPAAALDESGRKQIEQLMADARYLDAWQLADRLDPQNADLDLNIRKAQILLHGLVLPADTNRFWLKDGLPEPTDPGVPTDSLTAIDYPLLDILQSQAKLFPASQALWLLIGSANWQAMKAQVGSADRGPAFAAAAYDSYARAAQLGSTDGQMLWRMGVLLSYRGDYLQAATVLQRALSGQEKNAELRFDLAYALWLKGDGPAALEQARLAREGFKEKPMQAMAQLLMADIRFSLKDYPGAFAAYSEIYRQDMTNLYPLRRMIECNLISGDNAGLEQNTLKYAESLPVNPDSIYRLTMLFMQYKKQEVLFAVTKTLKQRYAKARPEISGLMCIYEALVLVGTDRRPEAVTALDEARAYLGNIYGPDHPVTLKIQELYSSAKQ